MASRARSEAAMPKAMDWMELLSRVLAVVVAAGEGSELAGVVATLAGCL